MLHDDFTYVNSTNGSNHQVHELTHDLPYLPFWGWGWGKNTDFLVSAGFNYTMQRYHYSCQVSSQILRPYSRYSCKSVLFTNLFLAPPDPVSTVLFSTVCLYSWTYECVHIIRQFAAAVGMHSKLPCVWERRAEAWPLWPAAFSRESASVHIHSGLKDSSVPEPTNSPERT